MKYTLTRISGGNPGYNRIVDVKTENELIRNANAIFTKKHDVVQIINKETGHNKTIRKKELFGVWSFPSPELDKKVEKLYEEIQNKLNEKQGA